MTTPSEIPPPQPNTLGKASLVLGICASVFVFFVGLCASAAQQQGWLPVIGTVLVIFGGTSAFMGLVAALLGLLGLFGRNRSRATAIAGFLLGLFAVALFVAIVNGAK